jgi:hypothetical protein
MEYQEFLAHEQYDPYAYPTDEDAIAQQMEQVSSPTYLSRVVVMYYII